MYQAPTPRRPKSSKAMVEESIVRKIDESGWCASCVRPSVFEVHSPSMFSSFAHLALPARARIAPRWSGMNTVAPTSYARAGVAVDGSSASLRALEVAVSASQQPRDLVALAEPGAYCRV